MVNCVLFFLIQNCICSVSLETSSSSVPSASEIKNDAAGANEGIANSFLSKIVSTADSTEKVSNSRLKSQTLRAHFWVRLYTKAID